MNSLSLSLDILKSALFRDPAALSRLLTALENDDASLRRRSAAALGRLVPDAEAAPPLVRRLDDDDPRVRELAALALKRMGAAAVPALVRAIDQEAAPRRRSACLLLLGLHHRLPTPALPALGRALKDRDPEVRRAAAWALLRGRARRRRSHRPDRKPLAEEPSANLWRSRSRTAPSLFGCCPAGAHSPSIISQSRLSRIQNRLAATATRA